MRLINVETLELREFTAPPRYAILSHRWANEELTFKDYHKLHELNTAGVEKIKRFCAFVRAFKVPAYHIESDERLEAEKVLEWAWIDTCCIDKSSSSELSEAINSMWAWYRNAEYCVAYLNDVQNFSDRCVTPDEAQSSSPAAAGSLLDDDGRCNTADSMRTEMRSLLKTEVENSEWFTRGWTLQELLAPGEVIFCDQCWHTIGRKKDYGFCKTIAATTGIPLLHLLDHLTLSFASVAQKLSWASKRVTTKDEDLAYSLLGLCDVNMPLLYGEKGKAFLRLQEEIIKQSDDESIFAWTRVSTSASTADWLGMYNDIPVLAEHPRDFERSQNVRRSDKIIRQPYSITNKGLLFVADAAYNGLMKIYIIRLNAEIRPAVDNGVGSSDYGTTSCLIAVKEKADRSFGRVGCNSLDLSNWNGSRTMIDRLIPSGLHHVKEKRFLIETRWYHNRYERGRGPRAAKGDQLQCVVDQANAST